MVTILSPNLDVDRSELVSHLVLGVDRELFGLNKLFHKVPDLSLGGFVA